MSARIKTIKRLQEKLQKRREIEKEKDVKAGDEFLKEVFGQTDADGTPLTFDKAVKQVQERRAHRKAVADSLKEEQEYGANLRASIEAIKLLEKEKEEPSNKKKKKKKKSKTLSGYIGDRLKALKEYLTQFEGIIIEEWKTEKSDDELKKKQDDILDYIRRNTALNKKLVVKGGYATHLHVGDKYITDDIDMIFLTENYEGARKELTSLFKGWYDRDGDEDPQTQVRRQMKDNSVGDKLSKIQPLKIYHKIKDKQPILEITFEEIDKNHEIKTIDGLKVFTIDSLLNILLKVSENFEERLIARKTQQTTESIYDKKIFNWYNQMRELLRVYNQQYFDELYPDEKKEGRKKHQKGGMINEEFRKLLLGLSEAQGDQEKIDRALINHIKYFIKKDVNHITVKDKKKSLFQFGKGSTQSSVIYSYWRKHIINDICHNTRRVMGLTTHSYGCENISLSNDPKKERFLREGLDILFEKYIYIKGERETNWLDKETSQFIDSKNSVFHRAKDEIRKERKEGGRKKKTRKKKRKYKKRRTKKNKKRTKKNKKRTKKKKKRKTRRR